jgi:hypothetical protein
MGGETGTIGTAGDDELSAGSGDTVYTGAGDDIIASTALDFHRSTAATASTRFCWTTTRCSTSTRICRPR